VKPEDILKTEFSEDFVQKMRNRMVVGFAKYGPIARHFEQGDADALDGAINRLDEYVHTKNTEWLIDAANYCMIEFMYPGLLGAHFKPTNDKESPGPAPRRKDEHKKD